MSSQPPPGEGGTPGQRPPADTERRWPVVLAVAVSVIAIGTAVGVIVRSGSETRLGSAAQITGSTPTTTPMTTTTSTGTTTPAPTTTPGTATSGEPTDTPPPTVTVPPSLDSLLPTSSSTSSPPATKKSGAPASSIPGDGTYVVGTDIAPGTYRAAHPSTECFWTREKNLTGDSNASIASEIESGPAIVTILSTDKGFRTQGCGSWTTNLGRISASTTSIRNGTWIVGVDVKPGTYRSTGGQNCYWETDSNFEHNFTNSIITNDDPKGRTVVQIPASVKAFRTDGCATWTAAK